MGAAWCVAERTRSRLVSAGKGAHVLLPSTSQSKRQRLSSSPSSSLEILSEEPETAAVDLDDKGEKARSSRYSGDSCLYSSPPDIPLSPRVEEISISDSEDSETRIKDRSARLGNSIATRTRSSKFNSEQKTVDYTGFFKECDESSGFVHDETVGLDGGVEVGGSGDFKEDLKDNGSTRRYRKRKHDQAFDDDPLLQKLLEIRNRGPLPSVFSFGDDDEEPLEKSDYEKWIDELWDEYDLVLSSTDTDSKVSENYEQSEEGGSHCSACKNGNHEFVLDEQIGLRCRICFFVQQEIRHIFPSVATESQHKQAYFSQRSLRGNCQSPFSPPPPGVDQEVDLKRATTVWDTIPGVRSMLFPHQQDAFEFLWKNLAGHLSLIKQSPFPSSSVGGCVIAHKPGSGKTRLAITFIQSFLRLHPLSLAVVVVPKIMLRTWENEFRKWKVNVPINVLEGSRDAPPCVHLQRGVLLLSFGVFSRLANVADRLDSLLVVDECHTARNDRSQLWRALNQARTLNRVLLSGTLFQNNLDELRNTLRLARPRFEWQANLEENRFHELREMMRPFVHVYGGGATALPPLKDLLLLLDPSPMQRQLLKAMEEEKGVATLWVLHRSSLAAVHPSLGGSATTIRVEHKSSPSTMQPSLGSDVTALDAAQGVKTRFVAELVKRCMRLKEKVLVFGQFLQPLELLGRQLEELFKWEEGKEVLRMDGDLSAAQREEVTERFNEEGGIAKVLLASTKACSEGISLIGASRVVLLDVVWNPAVEWQAISRAYRFGQRRAVYVYRLVAEEAGEWKKHVRQVQKNRLARLVMSLEDGGDGRGVAAVMDLEDVVLKEMMEDYELKGMFKRVICDPMESNISDKVSIS